MSGSGSAAPSVTVHVFGRTDVGQTREHNEDAFAIADLTTGMADPPEAPATYVNGERGSLFMVADGMGGAAAGEIASQMAVEVVLREVMTQWSDAHDHDADAFAHVLKRATAAANAEIHAFAVAHGEYRGMGTTATIAGLLRDTLYVAQVGDSRAYLVRDGRARQITKDQSLIQKLVDAGEITEEEARVSDRRNIILQALGPEANIKVDVTHQAVRRGDFLVLCSDGLSGLVHEEEIGTIASEAADLSAACARLIDTANARGGPDNITVIVARFDGETLARPSSGDVVGHLVYTGMDSGQTPAMGVPAIADPSTTTLELPRPSDGTRRRTAPMEPPSAVSADAGAMPAATAIDPAQAAEDRRRRGMLIMAVLLLAMLAGAAWLAWRFTTHVIPNARGESAPASAPAAQPTAQPAAPTAQ
jgi:PPM family protein phosphatase